MEAQSLLKVAVIGLGKMGVLHSVILSALPGARLVAVCDTQRLVSSMAGKLVHGLHCYHDYVEMIEKEAPDAIIVSTPIQTHVAVVSDVLNRYPMSVFVEKPLAANAEDAQALARVAGNSRVTNMVGYQKRFNSTFRRGKALLDSRVLGQVLFYKGSAFSSDVFRTAKGWRFAKESGGALLELGCHLVDLAVWYFGEPTEVEGAQSSLFSPEVDDYTHATFRHSKEVVGHIDVSWSVRGYRLPETSLEIHGSDGRMVVTDDYIRLSVEKPVESLLLGRELLPGDHILYRPSLQNPPPFLYGDPEYSFEDEAFIRAASVVKSCEPSFEVAAAVNRVLDIVRQNATHRRGGQDAR